MPRRYANVNSTASYTPEATAAPTPVALGGTQAIAPEVGYAGSFAPQMSAPISFNVQGGGTVGAGKTVRGSRLGRGGPELMRPVSGSVTMGNVSISSTMSPTFSNIGNVNAGVTGVTGGQQTQTSPTTIGLGGINEIPSFTGVAGGGYEGGSYEGSIEGMGSETLGYEGGFQKTNKTKGEGKRPGAGKSKFKLAGYDLASRGGAGFGEKDINYLRSQGLSDKQIKNYAKGLGANVNVGNKAQQLLGLGIQAPTPSGNRPNRGQQTAGERLANQMGLATPTRGGAQAGPYAPGKKGSKNMATAAGQLASQMTPSGAAPATKGQQKAAPAKAESAKAKAQVSKSQPAKASSAPAKAEQAPAKAESAKAKAQVTKAASAPAPAKAASAPAKAASAPAPAKAASGGGKKK